MSQSRRPKPRRAIPKHIQRAVEARDGNSCRRCGVVTEFLQWDHLVPFDVGGPTTEGNIQRLCPTCNTSKGNKIQCGKCGHWMPPDKSRCAQCETPLVHTKYSKTLRGRLERLFHRVGIAAVLAVGGFALLLFATAGVFLTYYLVIRDGTRSESAANVNTIVNESFTALPNKPANFKIVIPQGARNSRVVGGFKVTSGSTVNFYIVAEHELPRWTAGSTAAAIAQREQTNSTKIRQPLPPGTYYLLFASPDPFTSVTIAAELYSKYD